MKSATHRGKSVLKFPRGAAIRLIPAFLVVTAAANAQPVPASIDTIHQPTFGRGIFDSVGNVYYTGPPTISPQLQDSNGTCYTATGFIGLIPIPCSDAQVV